MKITAKLDAKGKAIIITNDASPAAIGMIDLGNLLISITDGTSTIQAKIGEITGGGPLIKLREYTICVDGVEKKVCLLGGLPY